tara:strand:+ start:154 stop:357 length:204 start_codon:yes stop_codon:yes gene_type:complete
MTNTKMYKVYFTQTIEDEYQRTVRASSPQDAEEKLKERWSGDIEVHNVDDLSADGELFDPEDMGDYI